MEIEKFRTGILIAFLIVCSYWDVRFKKLPLWFLTGGLIVGMALETVQNGISMVLVWELLPGILLWFLSVIFPHQIGTGDGWMIAAAGVLGGGKDGLLILEMAFLFMLPAAFFWFLIKHRKEKELPFAPFMLSGYVCLLIFRWAAG